MAKACCAAGKELQISETSRKYVIGICTLLTIYGSYRLLYLETVILLRPKVPSLSESVIHFDAQFGHFKELNNFPHKPFQLFHQQPSSNKQYAFIAIALSNKGFFHSEYKIPFSNNLISFVSDFYARSFRPTSISLRFRGLHFDSFGVNTLYLASWRILKQHSQSVMLLSTRLLRLQSLSRVMANDKI
eukprot:scaffold916_cov135-Amphora_coffeaeformis.AAC.1